MPQGLIADLLQSRGEKAGPSFSENDFEQFFLKRHTNYLEKLNQMNLESENSALSEIRRQMHVIYMGTPEEDRCGYKRFEAWFCCCSHLANFANAELQIRQASAEKQKVKSMPEARFVAEMRRRLGASRPTMTRNELLSEIQSRLSELATNKLYATAKLQESQMRATCLSHVSALAFTSTFVLPKSFMCARVSGSSKLVCHG